jgi:hypothetical protein
MWIDIEQNTDAWLDARSGKVTGSAVACIMANYGKAFGEPAKKLAIDLAVERVKKSRIQGDRYSNKHMEAGHLEEPVARELYQSLTGRIITNGGFYDNGNTGCSPDGRILFEEGGIEIKSVIPSVHFKTDKSKSFDPKYKWQLMFNMKEADWEFIDYTSYCEQYAINEKLLLIVPVEAHNCKDEYDMIDTRLDKFEDLIAENIKVIKGG